MAGDGQSETEAPIEVAKAYGDAWKARRGQEDKVRSGKEVATMDEIQKLKEAGDDKWATLLGQRFAMSTFDLTQSPHIALTAVGLKSLKESASLIAEIPERVNNPEKDVLWQNFVNGISEINDVILRETPARYGGAD